MAKQQIQHFSDRELSQVMDVLLNLFQNEKNYDALQGKALNELRKRGILPKLQAPDTHLNEEQMILNDERKQLIGTVFEVFFAACPGYNGDKKNRDSLSIFSGMFDPSFNLNSEYQFDYNDNNIANSVIAVADGFTDILSGNGEAILPMIVLLVLSVSFLVTVWSLYYLLSQSIDGLERVWYKEGWQQAFLPVLTGLAVGTAVGLLAGFFLTAPIAALALAAGVFTPVGFIIAGIASASLLTAGITCFITKQLQDQVIKKTHSNAMDPQEPYRFRLTDEEEKRLEAQGLDPFKVKCAIALIHSDMKVQNGVPSRLSRLFSSKNNTKQLYLETIRHLRSGCIDQGKLHIMLGSKLFDFDFRGSDYLNIRTNKVESINRDGNFYNFDAGGFTHLPNIVI